MTFNINESLSSCNLIFLCSELYGVLETWLFDLDGLINCVVLKLQHVFFQLSIHMINIMWDDTAKHHLFQFGNGWYEMCYVKRIVNSDKGNSGKYDIVLTFPGFISIFYCCTWKDNKEIMKLLWLVSLYDNSLRYRWGFLNARGAVMSPYTPLHVHYLNV